MGTTTAPAATLADTQDLETTLHPTPMGMATLGLEHEVLGFSFSSVHTRAAVSCFLFPVLRPLWFRQVTDFTSYGSSNGYGSSNANVNGYSNGASGGYGASSNGYGGGSYGGDFGGSGDKMANLGAGLKTQNWGQQIRRI